MVNISEHPVVGVGWRPHTGTLQRARNKAQGYEQMGCVSCRKVRLPTPAYVAQQNISTPEAWPWGRLIAAEIPGATEEGSSTKALYRVAS